MVKLQDRSALKEYMIPHGDDAPSGENLEYDPAFAALEEAARPAEDRQMGDAVIPGESAEPRAVIAAAGAVLSRSHDLRAAALVAPARIATDGFPGLAEVLGYTRWCLEDHWATCHPQPDEDDGDLTMRVNAVMALADPATTLRAVRHAPLTRSAAFGRASLRDIEIIEGETQLPEGETASFDAASLAAAFRDTPAEVLDAVRDGVRAAQDHLRAVDAAFDAHAPGEGPNLAALQRLLVRAAARLPAGSGAGDGGAGDDAAAGAEAAPVAGSASGAAPRAPAPPPGTIASPADVSAALGRIIDYYAEYEPSSPIPVLLKRARRLVGADFLSIVKDMAPDGLDSVRLVGGIRDEDDEG